MTRVDENPLPWSQDIPDMRYYTGMMCSPFIMRIITGERHGRLYGPDHRA